MQVNKLYLDQLVPATWYNDWVLSIGWEPDTTTPVSVTIILQRRKRKEKGGKWYKEGGEKVNNGWKRGSEQHKETGGSKGDKRGTSSTCYTTIPGLCICILLVCSRVWWNDLWIQTQSVCYQLRMPHSSHPLYDLQTYEWWYHWNRGRGWGEGRDRGREREIEWSGRGRWKVREKERIGRDRERGGTVL